MTAQLVECPQCQAPLALKPAQGFCQCAYCGVRFAVEPVDGQSPRLSRWEPPLSASPDLELTLADAEDDVDYKRVELAEARAAYWQARIELQRLVAPLQNITYLAGLLALLAAFVTLFVFIPAQRIPGAASALLLAVTGWAFHREWQDAEAEGQAEVREAREAVREAQAGLNNALAHLQDVGLEPELLRKQLLAAQTAPPAGAGTP